MPTKVAVIGLVVYRLLTFYGPQATEGIDQMTTDLSSSVSTISTTVRNVNQLRDDLNRK